MTSANQGLRGKSPVPALLFLAGIILGSLGWALGSAGLMLGGYACLGLALAAVAILAGRTRR